MTTQTGSKSGLDRLVQRGRQAQDTALGCHGLAAADLLRAGLGVTDMERRKFEHSAATWTARGDMLHRIDLSQAGRLRAAAA
ncbi:MAG TPA: hypothetical protein VGB70_11420 [Allosphingosinicella sp.]|jgi:hypothetical protein